MNQRVKFLQDPCFTPGKKCELIKARPGNRMSPVTAEVQGRTRLCLLLALVTCCVLTPLRRLAFQIQLIFVNKLLLSGRGTRGGGVENVKDGPLEPQRLRLYFM